MKHKLIRVTWLFAIILVGICLFFYLGNDTVINKNTSGNQIVSLNEIQQLSNQAFDETDSKKQALVNEKIEQLQEQLKNTTVNQNQMVKSVLLLVYTVICLLFLLSVFFYIYRAILLPFDKMKQFAESIAAGNLTIPLDYERSNYFGAFTWAFDQMRCEIIRSRACEKEAIENNKTVIATLSHDIKTPIASIRAYAEGLEANLDQSMEKRAYYVNVIMRKCDEVAQLTNDLFLHSLSDLNKLQVVPEEVELNSFLSDTVSDLAGDKGDIGLQSYGSECHVMIDPKRFVQVIENLVNNARKYAKTKIDISMKVMEDSVQIMVRDYGQGIPDADVPFIFDKFYRGKNSSNEQGSGLGLYISNYIMGQMQGTIQMHNHTDGLEVILCLPLKK